MSSLLLSFGCALDASEEKNHSIKICGWMILLTFKAMLESSVASRDKNLMTKFALKLLLSKS